MATQPGLPDLINSYNALTANATEVLSKLGAFANSQNPITFNLTDTAGAITQIQTPSIPSMTAELQVSGLGTLNGQVNTLFNLTSGLQQAIVGLNVAVGLSRSTQNGYIFDFTNNADANTTDPLYRVNVEAGSIGFPFDGNLEVIPERRYTTDGSRVGDTLMPFHTEDIDIRASSSSSYLNINQYPAFTQTVTNTVTSYSSWYYGGYYWWLWGYYSSGYSYSSYTYTYQIPGVPLYGSQIAQTFKVTEPRILKGITLGAYSPGSYLATTVSMLIVQTTAGSPNLSKVVGKATLRNDANNNSGGGTSSPLDVQFDLVNPILLDPSIQYAFVIVASSIWQVWYASNQTSDGQVMYTQDGNYWTSDLAKDLIFKLRYANFSSSAGQVQTVNGLQQQIIEVQPISLSGGVSSLSQRILADYKDALAFQVSINGNWMPISTQTALSALPAQMGLRAIFTGTTKIMPLLNVANSKTLALRPATSGTYISQPRTSQQPNVPFRVSFSCIGFKAQYHTVSLVIKVNGVEYTPTVQNVRNLSDGNTTNIDMTFTLPSGQNSFYYIFRMTTLVATQTFNITNFMEYKGGL